MMISPEAYYEMFLKGKTAEQIRAEIRSLQREIRRLRRPTLFKEKEIKPDRNVRLKMTCAYLERACQALMDQEEYLSQATDVM